MVIIPEIKKIFIHVPRTGGMAVSLALNEQYPKAIADLTLKFIHAPRSYFGPSWSGYEFVAVMRSPWDIYASHFRWCRMMTSMNQSAWMYGGFATTLRDYVDLSVKTGLSGTVNNAITNSHICREPGFYSTYCGDDVRVIMYGDHGRELSEVFQCDLNMPRINSAPPLPGDSAWDEESVNRVANQCRDDIERFGFHYEQRIVGADLK